jgi:hypothetical protein
MNVGEFALLAISPSMHDSEQFLFGAVELIREPENGHLRSTSWKQGFEPPRIQVLCNQRLTQLILTKTNNLSIVFRGFPTGC